MTKLMKAEWYRFVHSGKYFVATILVCLLCLFLMFLERSDCYKLTLSENLMLFSGSGAVIIPFLLCTVIASAIGASYSNRTAYYEVMDGNSIHKIILSKVFVYTLAICGMYLAPLMIYFGVTAAVNGVGDKENPAFMCLMLAVIIVHIATASALAAVTIKSLMSALIGYVRYAILEGMGMMLLPELLKDHRETLYKIFDWLISGQQMLFSGNKLDNHAVVAIIGSFVIEFALLYGLAYLGYRKKNFTK